MITKSLQISITLLLASLLSSCNFPPKGVPYLVAEKNFSEAPFGTSRVFVYFGPFQDPYLEALTIKIDGKKIGMIGANSFIFADIPQGNHSLDAYWAYSLIRSKLIFDTTQAEELYIQVIWNPSAVDLMIIRKPSSVGKEDISQMQFINEYKY